MELVKPEKEIRVFGLFSAFRYTFQKDFRYNGEKHEGWEFVFVESGKMSALADDKKYIIKSGEMICHKPMEFHNLNPYHSDATAIIFCFHCADEKMQFFENKILSVNQRQRLYLSDIITHAEAYFDQKDPLDIAKDGFMVKKKDAADFHMQFIQNSIELLLLSLYSSRSLDVVLRVNSYTQHLKRKKLSGDIKAYLEENLDKPVHLSELAARFSYSSSTLKTVFKEETGYSIIAYYNKLRLDTAKRLLLEKNHSISEIAYTLGFHTPSHFSSFFKKMSGLSPRAFVEEAQSLKISAKKK
ncbi:MAG: helix-turn-helix transcriptional regulator [Clostridia bacterium]|nr:helix-turn-helix transcriptional regulator [Clostridia bacterium]